MGYYACLQHGSRYLRLDDKSPFALGTGWRPPGASSVPLMTGGTLANQFDGGELVYESFLDRNINIPIRVYGGSGSQTHNSVGSVDAFISRGLADRSEKLYFVFGPSDAIPYTPKWGQRFYKYEIKANVGGSLGDTYGIASISARYIEYNLSLKIAPFTTGERQRVGSATGGILEHTWATADGQSRGLIVPPAKTNKIKNPVFGHGTAYDNGYTSGAGTITSKNTDKEFIFAGSASMKYTRISAANVAVYASSDAGNTNAHILSCRVKKPDGSAVTAADAKVYYGSAVDSNYLALGDGWYLVWAGITGIAAATNTGFAGMAVGKSLYVDGLQLEETNLHASPLIYGDLLDCAWSGTVHASTSVRTVSRWKTTATEIVDIAAGSISFSLRMGTPYNTGADFTLCADGNAAMMIFYDAATDKWQFYDGTTTIGSGASADDFAIGDLRTITATWGDSGIALYKNGVLLDSNATYTPPALHADFYIGSRAAPNQHHNSTYLDAISWSRQLTAAQVLADYNNISPHISGGDGYGQRLNPIPWLWTDDGDDILDSYYDATHENFCVYGGIPGNSPAKTTYYFALSDTNRGIAMSRFMSRYYVDMTQLFADYSGHVDGTALGGEVEQLTVTVGPSGVSPTSATISLTDIGIVKALAGIPFRCYASVSDGGSGLQMSPELQFGNVAITNVYVSIAAGATRKNFISDAISSADYPISDYSWIAALTLALGIGFDRNGTDTTEIDYMQAMLGDYCYIRPTAPNTKEFILAGKKVTGLDSSRDYSETTQTEGNIIDLSPNTLNHMVIISGTKAQDTVLAATTTISRTYVTPRWMII